MGLNSRPVTDRQQEVLDFIITSTAAEGFPPTHAEIATHFNFSSVNAAAQHLRALESKGCIVVKPGSSRGIKVVV